LHDYDYVVRVGEPKRVSFTLEGRGGAVQDALKKLEHGELAAGFKSLATIAANSSSTEELRVIRLK
jgi:hypothetical protein